MYSGPACFYFDFFFLFFYLDDLHDTLWYLSKDNSGTTYYALYVHANCINKVVLILFLIKGPGNLLVP